MKSNLVAFLTFVWLVVGVAPGGAAYADAGTPHVSGIVWMNTFAPNTWLVRFPDDSDIQLNDVFTIQHGGHDMGQCTAIKIHNTEVTVKLKSDFKGTPRQGDTVLFESHPDEAK